MTRRASPNVHLRVTRAPHRGRSRDARRPHGVPMTRIFAAETTSRPASEALEQRFAAEWNADVDTAALDSLALEQARINAEIAGLVQRMDADLPSLVDLDRITGRIAELLSRAEQVRIARAWAAARRAGDEARWAEYLPD